ncbi:sugar phosphate isomerase/epimerase family protein [Celeribacter baekdonensis]|uniref:Xylose isomerase domain-containing protein n=1 Tax=Celeribacter baekdonensis B30 TaxID=1208323 RepID=K2J3L7_9RHOB|nr:sugar phosphate isomerase/epimerase [Celeribacter baekdonensis]EKE69638.1 xylose isomerase domain-containing protein [Celeribacter baekdonensis B30]
MTYKSTTLVAVVAALCATTALAQNRAVSDLPIAIQMYTLRDHGTLEEQLAAVEAAGITAVETVGFQNQSADALKALLDTHGITAISTHAQLADLRDNLDEVVAFNETLGNSYLTVPYLAEDMRPTDVAGWTALGEELKQIANEIADDGMTLAYHNHDFEMVEYDGRTALEIVMEAAGPEVMAEIDLAWVDRGGLDPAEYLGRFDGRVFAVHVKDNAPEGENTDQRGFAIPGQGTLDWASILQAAEDAGVHWYIIEHDLPVDAAAVATEGADFLVEMLPESATR